MCGAEKSKVVGEIGLRDFSVAVAFFNSMIAGKKSKELSALFHCSSRLFVIEF